MLFCTAPLVCTGIRWRCAVPSMLLSTSYGMLNALTGDVVQWSEGRHSTSKTLGSIPGGAGWGTGFFFFLFSFFFPVPPSQLFYRLVCAWPSHPDYDLHGWLGIKNQLSIFVPDPPSSVQHAPRFVRTLKIPCYEFALLLLCFVNVCLYFFFLLMVCFRGSNNLHMPVNHLFLKSETFYY